MHHRWFDSAGKKKNSAAFSLGRDDLMGTTEAHTEREKNMSIITFDSSREAGCNVIGRICLVTTIWSILNPILVIISKSTWAAAPPGLYHGKQEWPAEHKVGFIWLYLLGRPDGRDFCISGVQRGEHIGTPQYRPGTPRRVKSHGVLHW